MEITNLTTCMSIEYNFGRLNKNKPFIKGEYVFTDGVCLIDGSHYLIWCNPWNNVNYHVRVVSMVKLQVKTSQRGKLFDYIVSPI